METYTYNPTDKKSANLFVGKVFKYMFLGILLTTIIAFVLGIAFTYWIFGTLNVGNRYDLDNISALTINETAATTLFVVMIASAIATFIISIVMNVFGFKSNHSLTVPYILYTSVMGVMLSSFVVFVPWTILASAFGITTLIFGLMALVAFLSKGSLNIFGVVGIGLFLGSIFLSLIGFIFYLTGAVGAYLGIYWLVSFLSFAGILMITIWDLWRIKQIANSGAANDNQALYCAFNLYVDFIYILIRIVYFLLRIYARNK